MPYVYDAMSWYHMWTSNAHAYFHLIEEKFGSVKGSRVLMMGSMVLMGSAEAIQVNNRPSALRKLSERFSLKFQFV